MSTDPKKDDDSLMQTVKAMSILSGTGIYLACVIGICLFAGIKFDEWASTDPVGKLLGIIVGFPVGIYSLYRQIKKHNML